MQTCTVEEISLLDVCLRLAVALVLCAFLGLERESRGQVAGMRTHILVGVGSALFTLISAYGFTSFVESNPAGGAVVTVDPTRIAAQIVAGIGFLGAGAIITQGMTVRGLTTAATLWMAAALGMAAGAGYILPAIAATVFVLLALVGIRRLRSLFLHRVRSEIALLHVAMDKPKRMAKLLVVVAEHGGALQKMDSAGRNIYRLEILLPGNADIIALESDINDLKGTELHSLRAARSDAFRDDE